MKRRLEDWLGSENASYFAKELLRLLTFVRSKNSLDQIHFKLAIANMVSLFSKVTHGSIAQILAGCIGRGEPCRQLGFQ